MIFSFVNLVDHLSLAFGRHIVWFFFNNRGREEVGRRHHGLYVVKRIVDSTPNMVTVLVTPDDFVAQAITQYIENKVVGDSNYIPIANAPKES